VPGAERRQRPVAVRAQRIKILYAVVPRGERRPDKGDQEQDDHDYSAYHGQAVLPEPP